MNNSQKGRKGEDAAVFYLKTHFYKILERNYRCRYGEIDIIAKKGGYIIFIEVKFRKNDESGQPFEAVNSYKQQHIRNTAANYLQSVGLGLDTACRFDVIDILNKRITHYKNAF